MEDNCPFCGSKLVGNKTGCLRCGRLVAYDVESTSVGSRDEGGRAAPHYCPACGAESVGADQSYCGKCGEKLSSGSEAGNQVDAVERLGGEIRLTPSPAPPRARTLVLGYLALFVAVLGLYAWWAYGAAQSRLEERIDSLGEALILAHEAAVSSDPVKSAETYRAAELKAGEAYGMPGINEFMYAYSLFGNAESSPDPSDNLSKASETLARARHELRKEFEATSEPSAVTGTWVFYHGDIILSETGQWTQGEITGTWAPHSTGLSPGAILLTPAGQEDARYEMLVLERVPSRALVFYRSSGSLQGIAYKAKR